MDANHIEMLIVDSSLVVGGAETMQESSDRKIFHKGLDDIKNDTYPVKNPLKRAVSPALVLPVSFRGVTGYVHLFFGVFFRTFPVETTPY
jgi:hypothetical protein